MNACLYTAKKKTTVPTVPHVSIHLDRGLSPWAFRGFAKMAAERPDFSERDFDGAQGSVKSRRPKASHLRKSVWFCLFLFWFTIY